MNFQTALISELLRSLNNHHADNYDPYRFGPLPAERQSLPAKFKNLLRAALRARGFIKVRKRLYTEETARLVSLEPSFPGLSRLYEVLSDDASKRLLVQLVAFNILGPSKIKLPLSTPAHWEGVKSVEAITDYDRSLDPNCLGWKLYFIDLNKLSIPLQIYFTPMGAYIDFLLKQYEYKKSDGTVLKAGKDDYVIDAGGCWGDTALYFANEVGTGGRVFSYEFIPGNLSIFRKNLALNPALQERIVLLEHPVWEKSGSPVYFTNNGPASRVSRDSSDTHDGEAESLSIDDMVERNKVAKIDFIKMDIEGAELPALKGAVKTLQTFKPRLAIAIYHSWNDFVEIPEFILSLGLGYKLCLGHYTVYAEETILFAYRDT